MEPIIEFTTTPVSTPEVRGGSGYFIPNVVTWRVSARWITVIAAGSQTRTSRPSRSEARWVFDELPAWVEIPWALINIAQTAINDLEAEASR